MNLNILPKTAVPDWVQHLLRTYRLIGPKRSGICSVSHTLTSIQAIEQGLGIKFSLQTRLLRELCYYGEMLDAHIFHIYMLVAPALLGATSILPLAKRAPEVVRQALQMKKVAGEICASVAGRHTHPISMTVGDFTYFPTHHKLRDLARQMDTMDDHLQATIELFQHLDLPKFERATQYISLHDENGYAWSREKITNLDGKSWPIFQYPQVCNENVSAHSSAAKYSNHNNHHYMIQNGCVSEAHCVIPTAQNLANIESDMRSLKPTLLFTQAIKSNNRSKC